MAEENNHNSQAGEIAKEGAKIAAQKGVEAGLAAATGGASEPIVKAVKIGAKAFKGISDTLDIYHETDKKKESIGIIGVIIGCYFFLLVFSCLILSLIPGGTEDYKGTTFELSHKEKKLEEAENVTDFKKQTTDEDFEEYSYKLPLETAIQRYIYNTEEDNDEILKSEGITLKGNDTHKSFRGALHDQLTNGMWKIVKWDGGYGGQKGYIQVEGESVMPDKSYEGDSTLSSFYSNPYPYDLQESDNYPLIGNVFAPAGSGYESYNPKYNDVNYAEIMDVISQNELYNWKNCDFIDYLNLINNDKTEMLYFEMDVKWIPVYIGYKDGPVKDDGTTEKIEVRGEGDEYGSAEECAGAPETRTFEGVECTFERWYCKVKVKPFGLREEYTLAQADPLAKNALLYNHVNRELLNEDELYLRTYERKDKRTSKKSRLGPSYKDDRSEQSTIYEDLLNNEELIERGEEGKGRSAWYYIENPYNLKFVDDEYVNKILYSIDNLTEEEKKALIEWPEGTYTLDDFINFYIYQMEIQELSGQTGLCCFSSYMMIAQYLTGQTFSSQQIADFADRFCQSDGTFTAYSDYLSTFGLKGDVGRSSDRVWSASGIQSYLSQGIPVIAHVQNGYVGGKYYDKHYIVVVGMDEEGYVVADPGSKYSYAPIRHMTAAEVAGWSEAHYRVIEKQ